MIDQTKLNSTTYQQLTAKIDAPASMIIIKQLVDGAGYSYSRIAHRIGVCPSTIQKLATNPKRTARPNIFNRLIALYYKIFFGPYASPQAKNYIAKQETPLLDEYIF